jgi:UDP-glucose 4-epimerase
VIKAVLLVIADDSTIGEVFNVGGVGETTIKQLAEKIIERTNSSSIVFYTPYSEAYPPGYEDMQRRVPDTTKLRTHLNWQPTHSLETIIDDVAANKRK